MKKILIPLMVVAICTIFVPHDAFAKNFSIKLSESMVLDSGDQKPSDKKDTKKKDKAKKKETKIQVKKETKKKELTKSKGKKTWKKIVHPSKYNIPK